MKLTPASEFERLRKARKVGRGGNKYAVAPEENRTDAAGAIYASNAEMVRATQLRMLVRAGKINCLKRQPRFHLGCPENTYVADFEYFEDGRRWVEDVKGFKTQKFRRDLRLWRRYGPCPLKLLTWKRGRWKVEVIHVEVAT